MGTARHASMGLGALLLAGCVQTGPLLRPQDPGAHAPPRPTTQAPPRRTGNAPQPPNTSAAAGNQSVKPPPTGQLDLGPFQGPPRWGFDTQFAKKIARLNVFLEGNASTKDQRTGGDPRQALKLFTLNAQGKRNMTFHDVLAQQQVPGTLMECEYSRKTATERETRASDFRPEFIKIFFWQAGTRKGLTPKMVQPYQGQSDHIADMELGSCPENFAQALETGFGAAAFTGTELALQERHASIQSDFAQGLRGKADYAGWDQQAKPLTPAQDRTLAQELDAALRELETRRSERRLPAEHYYTTLNLKLEPAMAKLAGSGLAQARAIAVGEAGRKGFERWDAGVGFTVVSLAMRLHSFKQPGNLFTAVLGSYQQAYAKQMADKGALDRGYLKAMLASIEKYKEQEAAAAAAAPREVVTNTVWVMRPRQSALYRKINQGVTLVQAYGKAKADNERYLATLDQDIKSTRQAFWACYEKRCAEGGVLYHRFSALINARDRFDIQRTAFEGAIARSSNGRFDGMFSQLMGMDKKVDTQFVGACDHLYDSFLARLTNLMANPAAIAARVDEALNSESYLQVQQCRDRMEFILRPRGSPSGLL